MDCKHMNFRVDVAVGRLTESETSDVVVSFSADVHIKCADCGQPFEFIGLPMGMAHFEPRCSVDGLEARMPIKPQGVAMAMDLPSFGVRICQ